MTLLARFKEPILTLTHTIDSTSLAILALADGSLSIILLAIIGICSTLTKMLEKENKQW